MKDMGLIDTAQYRNRWLALVNAVMNLRVHKMRGVFRIAEDLLASHEGLCSMEFVSELVSYLFQFSYILQLNFTLLPSTFLGVLPVPLFYLIIFFLLCFPLFMSYHLVSLAFPSVSLCAIRTLKLHSLF